MNAVPAGAIVRGDRHSLLTILRKPRIIPQLIRLAGNSSSAAQTEPPDDTPPFYLARRALNTRIHQCNEGGKILVVESGRDCDCVEYSGRTRIIEASIKAFEESAEEAA